MRISGMEPSYSVILIKTEYCDASVLHVAIKSANSTFSLDRSVFQLENEKGKAPGRTLCEKWAKEGTFYRKQTSKL